MKTHETISLSIKNVIDTMGAYNKKLVCFETNVMLFEGASITKNTNELSLMIASLDDDVKKLLAETNAIGCTLEQYCINNGLEYEFNEFSVQKNVMEKLINSLEVTNNQIMDNVSSVLESEHKSDEIPTSIRRRTRHAKLKKQNN